MGESERGLEKVNFQQILGKTFLLLPLSALFKHHSLPILTSRPFEYLSRRRWNASPTKPWLMFKEKIMEMQCQDHTRENQKCVLLRGIWLNNILDVRVLHHREYATEWVECIWGGDKPWVSKQTSKQDVLMDSTAFDNGCKATCAWFSWQKECDSFACLYFLAEMFPDLFFSTLFTDRVAHLCTFPPETHVPNTVQGRGARVNDATPP